ncbi:MAG: hypothetical protein COT18_07710 [Elusimicrobia bacterium CG08_land_8_20_14_0_20_59_10]|nr:MAG: hypothetical protein COT18_07710 [Elusimicrobia bacterium CG08_land_8_20_14_0_20_59_10]
MKNVLFSLLTAALLSVPVFAAGDCSDGSDVCRASPAPVSPFLAASRAPESAPAPTVKKPVVKKPAPQKISVKIPDTPAVSPAAPAVASAADSVEAAPPEAGTLSSPLWLFFVFGGIACLYIYLRGGKRGKNKWL